MDGDLLVVFKDINNDKPMYFSSVDGDVDVTFPSGIKADMTIKTIDGDIYTDFEMDINRMPQVEKSESKQQNWIGIFTGVGNNISAKVNGGGPEIQLISVDGDIYIRKGK